jgi:hypothetical protein
MKVVVLTINFWDAEDETTVNFVRVYSTDELARQALADARVEYGDDVDYCITYATVDKDV